MTTGLGFVITLAVALGAWLLAWPFLKEHEAETKSELQQDWHDTLQQVRQIQDVASQVTHAITHVIAAQDTTQKCFTTAESLAERLQAEHQSLLQSLHQANDQEKKTLNLELEKQRRTEQEALQVIVHLLDHSYALFQAGRRSGQPALTEQLRQFRAACLDAARRLGIVAHEAQEGEIFDPRYHQTTDDSTPPPKSRIENTIACGYTYRGAGIRPIVVRMESAQTADETHSNDAPVADPYQDGSAAETTMNTGSFGVAMSYSETGSFSGELDPTSVEQTNEASAGEPEDSGHDIRHSDSNDPPSSPPRTSGTD
jgi:hypothetical protein